MTISINEYLKSFINEKYNDPDALTINYLDNCGKVKSTSNSSLLKSIHKISSSFPDNVDLVVLDGNKHPSTIAAIIAALISSKPFVILNPDISEAKRDSILSQLNSYQYISFEEISWSKQALTTVSLEAASQDLYARLDNASALTCSKNLAYIVFTSGSTGVPKGVQIRRESFEVYADYMHDYINTISIQTQLSLSPIFFDNFIFDLTIYLTCKATLFLAEANSLLAFLAKASKVSIPSEIERINFIYGAPSIISKLVRSDFFEFTNSTQKPMFIGLGGEPFSWQSAQDLFCKVNLDSRIINFYGPSECTCMCSSFELNLKDFERQRIMHEAKSSNLPIGTIFDYFSYLVENHNYPQTVTTASGNLLLGGVAIMEGYLDKNRSSFKPIDADIYYSTGDLVTEEGSILYIHGRIDNQIKILGVRIELEEIESRCKAILKTSDLLISTHEDRGLPRIAVIMLDNKHVSGDIEVHPEEISLLKELNSSLPQSMRISDVLRTHLFKLTANGKLDRKFYAAQSQSYLPTV